MQLHTSECKTSSSIGHVVVLFQPKQQRYLYSLEEKWHSQKNLINLGKTAPFEKGISSENYSETNMVKQGEEYLFKAVVLNQKMRNVQLEMTEETLIDNMTHKSSGKWNAIRI